MVTASSAIPVWYEPDEVMERVRALGSFAIPAELRPSQPLQQIGKGFFGNEVAAHRPYLAQAEIDPFLAEAPEGYFLIGHWGHGANSYAFYYQAVEPDNTIWLRLPYGGLYMTGNEGKEIETYLPALVRFLGRARAAGASVEVVESMWIGEYRLFDENGNGIRFVESLLGVSDLNRRFNRMLADLAVFEVEGVVGMNQFVDDDRGYFNWLAKNADGWVLNADRNPKPGYLILHRAGCRTISAPGVRYTSGGYIKVCADDARSLETWAWREANGAPRRCGICQRT